MSKNATRKIHKFDFTKEHHHVALVDKAANLTEVMLMKSDKEVTVTTSMRTFLNKFFDMWQEDAAILAGVLGYSTKSENEDSPVSYDDYIAHKVDGIQLLKGKDLPDKMRLSVTKMVEKLEKEYGDQIKTSEDSSEGDNFDIAKGESRVGLSKEEVEKQAADLEKALAQIETMKEQAKEVETLKSLVTAMEAKEKKAAKDQMVEVVKGYTFISEGDQESLVNTLLSMEDSQDILKAFEGARDALAAAIDIETEQGTSGGETQESETEVEKGLAITANILKSRKKVQA